MNAGFTIMHAAEDDQLFARWFRDRSTWDAWFAFLAAVFALPMTADQLATFRRCTGRTEPPTAPVSEAWLICGRRAGKSFVLALVAAYLACFHDYRGWLSPGERGTIVIVAVDRRQARTIFRYVRALLTRVPLLAHMVEREGVDTFDLKNSVTIEIGTASFRAVRGYTLVAALLDELAFFPTDDAAEPDYEIIDALRPGMATIPNAMLLCASSPYARRGALWEAWRRHFGKDGDPVLVWQADTRTMNPTVPQSVIDAATERDPASAAAEYGAQFRSDIESFVRREAVEQCVEPGVFERAPLSDFTYHAFADPSGGSADSFTLAVAHREGDITVVDAVRERQPPFSPDDVITEYAGLLRTYQVTRVTGDRYAGEFPRELFQKLGITYEPAARPKSDLYRDLLPVLNAGRLVLPEHPKLVAQLVGLERRTARGGRDSIDHAPGGHDDLANVVAGVVVTGAARKYSYDASLDWVG